MFIEKFGTEKKPIKEIYKCVKLRFSLSNIIKEMGLLKPQYKQTTSFRHFDREKCNWEKIKA